MSCACFGGNGGGIVSCPCGTDDEGSGYALGGDTEEGVCCTCGGDGEDVCCICGGDGVVVCDTCGGDGEDVSCTCGGDSKDACCTSGEDGGAVGGVDVSFGGRDPSLDPLRLSWCSRGFPDLSPDAGFCESDASPAAACFGTQGGPSFLIRRLSWHLSIVSLKSNLDLYLTRLELSQIILL